MTDRPDEVDYGSRLSEIIASLRHNLRELDELGLDVAAAHVSMAIDVLEAKKPA